MTLLHEATPTGNESQGPDVLVDYARMSDMAAMDALRHRLTELGAEGDNAVDLIGELRSNFVQNVHGEERHLVVSRLQDKDSTLRLTYLGLDDISDESYGLVADKIYSPHLAGLLDESGRGYSMMAVLSTDRGINRLTNQAGENIGVELWFNIRPDNNFPDLFDIDNL